MSQLHPRSCRRSATLAVLALALFAAVAPGPAAAAPSGQLRYAVHVSLAPTWFDPAETPSLITPFMVLYAMHDALVKFMPGTPQGKSLAEAWSVSKDGLVYESVGNVNALRPRSPAAGPRPHDVSPQPRTLEPCWSRRHRQLSLDFLPERVQAVTRGR